MPHSIGSGLGTVIYSQFGENAADIVTYGSFSKEKRLGDFTVGFALRNEQQDMFLLLTEMGKG
jgi:hypothetical protein